MFECLFWNGNIESYLLSESVSKVITANPECGLEMKHLKHLNKKQMKSFFLERTDNGATLKRNHQYFYQVQAQMEVTGFSETLFVVWSPNGCMSQTFARKSLHWQTFDMKPFLLKSVWIKSSSMCLIFWIERSENPFGDNTFVIFM